MMVMVMMMVMMMVMNESAEINVLWAAQNWHICLTDDILIRQNLKHQFHTKALQQSFQERQSCLVVMADFLLKFLQIQFDDAHRIFLLYVVQICESTKPNRMKVELFSNTWTAGERTCFQNSSLMFDDSQVNNTAKMISINVDSITSPNDLWAREISRRIAQLFGVRHSRNQDRSIHLRVRATMTMRSNRGDCCALEWLCIWQ